MFQKLKLHWLPQRTWHLMLISGFLQCFAGLTWLYIGNLSRFLGDWTVERAIVLGAIHGFCKGAFFVGLPVSIILFGIAIRRHVRFTAVEQGAASPSVPRFRRVAVAVALVVPLLQAWLLFDLAPQRRCRMAMQPFVDASGELVVRINELADRGKLDEASALIPSYRLIRGQGFLAAATEWIGSNGRKRMTQFGLNDPIWEISQRGRQSLIQRLRQDGSPRNTELADSLSHFKVLPGI